MSSFAPLREANFRWYFWSRLVNTAGGMMAPIALAFAVLEVEESPSALGTVLAARTIPMVIFLLLGGVVADRFGRALVLRWSNLLSAGTQGIVAALVISGQAELWHLIVLSALNGTVSAASFPAMMGIVPQLVSKSDLKQANVLLSMSRGALAVLGPTAAAALVVTLGPGWAVAIDAATWVLAYLLLLPVKIPAAVRTEGPGVLRELRDGWTYFQQTTWLWVIVLAFGVLNLIHAGAWFTLGPVIADQTFGPKGWGLILSAEALGLLLMTVVMLKLDLRRPLLQGMLGITTLALPITLLGIHPVVPLVAVGAFLAGAGTEIFNLGWNLAMQEQVPDEMLSRAYSYDSLGSFVAIPVGQLIYGPLGVWFGYHDVLIVSGVAYVAISALTLLSSDVRNLRRTSDPSIRTN